MLLYIIYSKSIFTIQMLVVYRIVAQHNCSQIKPPRFSQCMQINVVLFKRNNLLLDFPKSLVNFYIQVVHLVSLPRCIKFF